MKAYVENLELSELEFLSREFDLELISFLEWESRGACFDGDYDGLLIVINSPSKLIDNIAKIREAPIVVVILGNERKSRNDINQLLKQENVVRIYDAYFANKTRFRDLFCMFVGLIKDGGLTFRSPAGGLFRTLINGFRSYRSFLNYPYNQKIRKFLLGYTNNFVKELQTLGLLAVNDKKSLFRRAPLVNHEDGKRSIAFVGTRDSWCRDLAIQCFKASKNFSASNLILNESWGGKKSVNECKYVASMIEADVILCPPGYVSNKTFRFWESLLLGCFPLAQTVTLQDWSSWLPENLSQPIRACSWSAQIKWAETSQRTSLDAYIAQGLNEALMMIGDFKHDVSNIFKQS